MYLKILSILASLFIISLNSFMSPVHSQSIPYVVEVSDIAMTNKSGYYDENETLDLFDNCTDALEAFTETVTNLTRCSLLNARPIHICMGCVAEINTVDTHFKKLQKELHCHKLYFESDQIGIIDVVYNQGKDLWSRNHCQNCHDKISDTEEFFNVSRDFDNCMKLYNRTAGESRNDSCNMCEEFFIKMNKAYKKFVTGKGDGVCMDIVDQMNITRHVWSSLNCLAFDSYIGYRNIITAILVGIIPVLFYLLSKNVSIAEDVKLVRPKRKSYASLQDLLPSE